MEPEGSFQFQQQLPVVPVLNQIDAVHMGTL
jgi:hypothetical protein